MLPISFFVNRKLKATHETSEGTYQFFFSFGDIRKQKQNKTKKPSIIVDESGIARTTQITQVIILAQVSSFGNAAHTSQITPVEFISQTAA